ncbi:hypothetical protein ACTVKP_09585 [Serratia bockelmannii]|uniref:hypothetical protein n=1 Tax=Serratia bockelmannii TaxID=2703793 RepID=UPI003FA694E2
MDNKLSELSNPVAWEVKGILCHSEEEARVYVGEPEPLYSQEYVSALKHESAVNWEAAASLNVENQELKKRIAELEDAEQRLCAANVTLDARASEAEAKLATPVRLSCETHPRCRTRHAADVRAAGFKVEGDEGDDGDE